MLRMIEILRPPYLLPKHSALFITKSRDVNTQAVFSLKGKPLNSLAYPKKSFTKMKNLIYSSGIEYKECMIYDTIIL